MAERPLLRNKCLGTDGDNGLMTDCSDSPFHHWWIRPYKNGFTLINVGNSYCLDDSFAYNLRTITCNNTDWQGWW
ncbi:hypothetical protein ACFVY1_25635 [Streptomyces sp. NPDC058293]|uniref:hypothetical protein n=1 Tax=Streptomyces sp. NPDC058293 TaxID=3346429 RepID=UPI0036ED93BF